MVDACAVVGDIERHLDADVDRAIINAVLTSSSDSVTATVHAGTASSSADEDGGLRWQSVKAPRPESPRTTTTRGPSTWWRDPFSRTRPRNSCPSG